MKTCTKCGVEKELDDFYTHKGKKSGLTSSCKSCFASYRIAVSLRTKPAILTKKCSKCKVEKSSDEFHNNKGKASGKSSACKACSFEIKARRIPRAKPDDVLTKVCSKCKTEKPLDEFHNHKGALWGKKSSCIPCAKMVRELARQNNPELRLREIDRGRIYYKKRTPESIAFLAAKSRAKKKNLAFDLELEDIVIPSHCPVFGIRLVRRSGRDSRDDNSPSLDRIDNTKGYTRDNSVWMSWKANRLKNNSTFEELQQLVTFMERHRDGK